MRSSTQDRAFNIINYTILTIAFVILAYPLYLVLISSISDPNLVNTGKVYIVPRGITFVGYEKVLGDRNIVTGYRNSLLYTTTGIMINVSVTLLAGYALSRRELAGRKVISQLMVFTMLFSGGLIPLYLVVKNLGLLNTFGAMVLPTAVQVWNVIIARTFFQTTIPNELLEASKVDGCTNSRFFVSVVLPLSPALIAVQVLFYGVFHWNSFFQALMFLSDADRYPLQLVLRQILIRQELSGMTQSADPREIHELEMLAESIKYSAIVVSSLPVMILYPSLQRYFVKGVMIGAIKG